MPSIQEFLILVINIKFSIFLKINLLVIPIKVFIIFYSIHIGFLYIRYNV